MRPSFRSIWKDAAEWPNVDSATRDGSNGSRGQFDLSNHVSEILAGVARANSELGSRLEVEAIEVVPDDYPGKGQAEHVAYQIAMAVGRSEV